MKGNINNQKTAEESLHVLLENTLYIVPGAPTPLGITNMDNAWILILNAKDMK